VLENMVDADSVDDELEAEVSDECSKFGRVTHVSVSSERRDDNCEPPTSSSGDVKVFVEFTAQSGNSTGPPTCSVAGQTSNARWCLSSVTLPAGRRARRVGGRVAETARQASTVTSR